MSNFTAKLANANINVLAILKNCGMHYNVPCADCLVYECDVYPGIASQKGTEGLFVHVRQGQLLPTVGLSSAAG